jgi:hypothetical protein
MTYWTLLAHRWKDFWRSFREQRLAWLAALTVAVLGGAFGLGLVGAGTRFDLLLRLGDAGAVRPLTFLNQRLLLLFFGLFSVRLFLQRTPDLPVPAYLARPLSRRKLVRFVLGHSLLSLHNLVPLLFFVPFWMRFVLGGPAFSPGALFWGAGVLLALLASNCVLLAVRGLMNRRTGTGALLIAALIVLLALDTVTGRPLVQNASSFLFGALADGSTLALGGLVVLAGLAGWTAHHTLMTNLRCATDVAASPDDARPFSLRMRFTTSRVFNLALLELKLLRRNRRPRHYFLLSLLFGTLYLAIMLFDYQYFRHVLLEAVIGVFASGVFALNYGQLMFAWDSTHFDGLLARRLPPRAMVGAKLLVLQVSCAVFFLIGLPLFVWLAPPLVPLHLAFLLYNAGVTSVLVLLLALGNRRRVVLSKSGGFFNYEGFSLIHWLWVIPTTVPPVLLLYGFRSDPSTAYLILSGLGALSLLAFPLWRAAFTRLLHRRRYTMAQGFREA